MTKPVRVAMIGVGAISGIYLQNLTETFREVELIGVCDLIPERAETGVRKVREMVENGAKAVIPKIYKDMYEAFRDPEVEVVLNLTRPYEHFEVTKQALLHGKHVYSEKPLAVDMEEADALVSLAEEKGLLLGGAPDTFLGAGIQTARRIIDSGMIGDVIGATCAMVCHGHETWHPDPEFYYKRGGGPMLDMGPYYVTALVNLLGGVRSGMIDDGTAIGNGLATAINRLRESDAKSKVIILLTDGVNNRGEIAPVMAAEIAKEQGIRVYTIGVGSRGTAPTPAIDMFGNMTFVQAKVEIDEKTLQEIADATGGRYFRATDNEKLRAIYDEINRLEKSKVEVADFTTYTEEYLRWVLAALALLAAEFLIRTLILKRIP